MSELDAPGAVGQLFRAALAEGRRAWRQLLVTDLAYKLLTLAVFTPLVGLALRQSIVAASGPVLADFDIAFFLLRPIGIVVLIVIAALSLTLITLEQASLMATGVGAGETTRAAVVRALAWALRRARPALALSLRLVARVLLLLAPFAAGVGLVYVLLLREFDINYYLQKRPPVFLIAAGLSALLVGALLYVLARRLASWLLTLPLVLFEDVTPRRAFAESERRLAGARSTAMRMLLAWTAGAVLLSMVAPAVVFAIGRTLAGFARGQLALVLALMLLVLVLWGVTNLLVTCVTASAFALLLVQLHERCGGDTARSPARSVREDEIVRIGGARLSLSRLLIAVAAAAAIAAAAGIYLLRSVRSGDRIVVVAHRGGAAGAPENTLAAVAKGIADGADSIEIDVQETADGELAIVHDSDLMKVAGADLEIWKTTWDDLQRVDVGSYFGPEFSGERVPRLRDVLESARGRAKVTIELKYYGHAQQLEQRVVEQVEALGATGDVEVISLDYEALRKVRALRPGWTLGLLVSKAVGDLTELDADFLAVHSSLATRSLIRRAHARGKQVYVWTLNDPVRMFAMISRGVDGVITDRPAMAREVLARRAELSSAERLVVGLAIFFGAAAPDPDASVDGG